MTRSPRREWKSFLWPARWSVRLRIRSDRIATCTSGEPVSPDLRPYSPMSACLRSWVIDIDLFPSTVYHAHRPQPVWLDAGQCDKKLFVASANDRALLEMIETRPLVRILRHHPLTMAQPGGFGCRQGEGRDVVQRRLDRQQMLGSGETMPKRQCRIQRNRLSFVEVADGQPTELDDMPWGAERFGEVAGQCADIRPLPDHGIKIGMIGIVPPNQPPIVDVDPA